MAEIFEVDELIIYPQGAQALIITDQISTNFENIKSIRLPQNLISSTLEVTDQDDQQVDFSLVPAKSIKDFLYLQPIEVHRKGSVIEGSYLRRDKRGLELKVDDVYMFIENPEIIKTMKFYEIYPLISIFRVFDNQIDNQAKLRFMIKSLSWSINYIINLSQSLMKIRSQASIVNNTSDKYISKKIVLQSDYQHNGSSRIIKQFEGDIPSREIVISIDQHEVLYDKYYKHIAGTSGAQLVYRFKSPSYLLSGSACIYQNGKYLGTSKIVEADRDKLIDIELGSSDLPISSSISVIKQFRDDSSKDQVITTKSSVDEPDLEEVSIKVKFNPNIESFSKSQEPVCVLLTYVAPSEIIETEQKTIFRSFSYVEWIPIKFEPRLEAQSVEIKLIQRIPSE